MAQERHFGRAAAKLNMTQPAVTQRLQALERELGTELLMRNARGVQLTATGELLLPYATRLVEISDEALRDLESNIKSGVGVLRVACATHVEVALTASIINEFRRHHQSVDIETTFAYSRLSVEQILDRSLDVAFVAGVGPVPPVIAYKALAVGEMLLTMPAEHKLAATKTVRAADLRGQGLILLPSALNPWFRSALESSIARHTGAEPRVVASEPHELAVESVARSRNVMTLVPEQYSTWRNRPGIVYRSLSPRLMFELGVIYRRDDSSRSVADFLGVVDEFASPGGLAVPEDGELIV